jgi:predicted ester cyclase
MANETNEKATVREMFEEVINKAHLDRIGEFFHADFVDHGPGGDLVGIPAFTAVVEAWRNAVPDVRCEVRNLIQEGDLLAWTVHTTGTHTGDGLGFPATGKRFETVSANLVRMRDGKAVEHWSEQGMLPLLQQLGILPAMEPPQTVA